MKNTPKNFNQSVDANTSASLTEYDNNGNFNIMHSAFNFSSA